jgi:hypothetical protein
LIFISKNFFTRYLNNTLLKFASVEGTMDIGTRIKLIYEDKKITELAICSGIDLATEEGRIEAAIVQIMYFISIDTETAMALASTDGFNRTIEMGGLEPLI